MDKKMRQYVGIFAAVILYYIVHEGAHLLTALCLGVFRQINFLGLGVQIDVYAERMTAIQLGLFCLSGAAATTLAGWLLIALCKSVCRCRSDLFRAVMWYATLIFLLLDPVYLSVLCGFFGGGDMNGIALLLPEAAARIAFALLGVVHSIIVWRYLLPNYQKSFVKE